MADPKAEVPHSYREALDDGAARQKKRSPKAGKRITVTLSDEHYEAVLAAAKADDREPNVYLSRVLRLHFEQINGA